MTNRTALIWILGGLAAMLLIGRRKGDAPAIGCMDDVPERVEGIPTGSTKEDIDRRREIVKKEYLKLCDHLQGKGVYNQWLGEAIKVKYRHGGHKATINAVKKWQNTYAVRHLQKVLAGSVPGADFELLPPKEGNQSKLGYIGVLKMYYTFCDERPYLNFTVEVVIGVTEKGNKYEYSVEIKA